MGRSWWRWSLPATAALAAFRRYGWGWVDVGSQCGEARPVDVEGSRGLHGQRTARQDAGALFGLVARGARRPDLPVRWRSAV